MIDVRRQNLRKLIAKCEGPTAFAKRLGYANASFITQMTGPNPVREVSEKTARRFERDLKLPEGILDDPQADFTATSRDGSKLRVEVKTSSATAARPFIGADREALVGLIRMVGTLCEGEGYAPPPARFVDLVAFALADAAERGEANQDRLRDVVRLMKSA